MIGRSSGPNESVVPPICQHSEPADTPPSTTPASHTSRKISSQPCSRQIASSPATLPPPTQTTSWASRCARTSATEGIGNAARLDTTTSRPMNASWVALANSGLSPSAVPT